MASVGWEHPPPPPPPHPNPHPPTPTPYTTPTTPPDPTPSHPNLYAGDHSIQGHVPVVPEIIMVMSAHKADWLADTTYVVSTNQSDLCIAFNMVVRWTIEKW